MPRSFETEIEVRGYELDSYGHVNHAVYVSYLEHGRWDTLHQCGITIPTFKKWGAWPVIANIELTYLKPCFSGDRLVIRTTAVERTRTTFSLEQEIRRGTEKVLQGRIRAVTVNDRGRPIELPAELVSALSLEET